MGDDGENGVVKTRLVGVTEPYVVGEDNFDDYLSNVENYFELNVQAISEEKQKVRLFVNIIGPTAAKKIINAYKPKSFSEAKYSELIEKCKKVVWTEKKLNR
jgi:hypothetical protein